MCSITAVSAPSRIAGRSCGAIPGSAWIAKGGSSGRSSRRPPPPGSRWHPRTRHASASPHPAPSGHDASGARAVPRPDRGIAAVSASGAKRSRRRHDLRGRAALARFAPLARRLSGERQAEREERQHEPALQPAGGAVEGQRPGDVVAVAASRRRPYGRPGRGCRHRPRPREPQAERPRHGGFGQPALGERCRRASRAMARSAPRASAPRRAAAPAISRPASRRPAGSRRRRAGPPPSRRRRSAGCGGRSCCRRVV